MGKTGFVNEVIQRYQADPNRKKVKWWNAGQRNHNGRHEHSFGKCKLFNAKNALSNSKQDAVYDYKEMSNLV